MPDNLSQNDQPDLSPQIEKLAREIHQDNEDFMGKVESYIALTGGDLSLVIYDLKRLVNFLDAVIEAHPITFRLAEIMEKLGLDEATLRQLFIDVGVPLEKEKSDPQETVTYGDAVALLADRAGSREGDLLADLLRGDSPKFVWG